MRRIAALVAALAVVTACDRSTEFIGWSAALLPVAESSAVRLERELGRRPDQIELCSGRRVRVTLTDVPGDAPIEYHGKAVVLRPGDRDAIIQRVSHASGPALAGLRFDTLSLVLRRTGRRNHSTTTEVHLPHEQVGRDSVTPTFGFRSCAM